MTCNRCGRPASFFVRLLWWCRDCHRARRYGTMHWTWDTCFGSPRTAVVVPPEMKESR